MWVPQAAAVGNTQVLSDLAESLFHVHLATSRTGHEHAYPSYIQESRKLRAELGVPLLYVVGPSDSGILSNECDRYLPTRDILSRASELVASIASPDAPHLFIHKP